MLLTVEQSLNCPSLNKGHCWAVVVHTFNSSTQREAQAGLSQAQSRPVLSTEKKEGGSAVVGCFFKKFILTNFKAFLN